MSEKKGNSFYIQGSILAAASIISRLLGLVFRMPLTRIIGDEGNGAYSNAYEVYNIALLLSTYGIPIAVSRLVSMKESEKQYKNSYKLFRVAMTFAAIVGLIFSVIVFVFAEPISVKLFKSPNSAIPLRTLAPTIFVFAIMGVIRGFFQGKNTVVPTAISQLLEQIVHVVGGLVFAVIFMKNCKDLTKQFAYGAAGGTFGTLLGALFGLGFLAFIYVLYKPYMLKRVRKDKTGVEDSPQDLLKLLLVTLLPIILNQFLYSVTGILDSTLFNNVLDKKGIDESSRLALYGIYSTKFRLITNVPLAIASAIGVAIIPNVVKAYSSGTSHELNEKIGQAVKLNMMIAIPSAAGLIALAKPVLMVCFRASTDTPEAQRALDIAVMLLVIGGSSVILFAYSTTTNSILQGIGKLNHPIIHAAIGIVIYLFVDFPLLKYTTGGVFILPIGYMVFPFIVCVLNWITIARLTTYRQELLNTFIKPLIYSVIMGVVAYLLYYGLGKIIPVKEITLMITIFVAVLIYGSLMLFTKTLSREEIVSLPMGGRILSILIKLGVNI